MCGVSHYPEKIQGYFHIDFLHGCGFTAHKQPCCNSPYQHGWEDAVLVQPEQRSGYLCPFIETQLWESHSRHSYCFAALL